MVLSKHQEHGMNALEILLVQIYLKSGRPILHYSQRLLMEIYLWVKYMLMVLYLVLLIKSLVKILAELWSTSLRFYDGRAEVLPRILVQTAQGWHLHLRNQVHAGYPKGCKAHQDTDEDKWTPRPRHWR
jgi:hypothetical protein